MQMMKVREKAEGYFVRPTLCLVPRKDGARQQEEIQRKKKEAKTTLCRVLSLARYLYLLIPRRIASSHKIVEYLRLGLHQQKEKSEWRRREKKTDPIDELEPKVWMPTSFACGCKKNREKKRNLDVTAIKVDEFPNGRQPKGKIIK